MSSFNRMMKQANKGAPKTATSNFPDDKKLEKSFEDQARLWVVPPKCPQKEEMMEQYKKLVKEAKKTATAKSKMPKIILETTSMNLRLSKRPSRLLRRGSASRASCTTTLRM